MNWQMGRRRPAVAVAPAVPVVAVGATILAACSKCKAKTEHVILAKVGVKLTRVECTTCKDAHAYKPALVTRRTPETVAGLSPKEAWTAYMRRAQGDAMPYAAGGRYTVGERVSHESFGEGVVARLASATVCEVVFAERTVKLVMGTAPPQEGMEGRRWAEPTIRPGGRNPRRRMRP